MEFKFFCPYCAQHIQVDSASCGSSCSCPNCSKTITIPHLDIAAPPVPPMLVKNSVHTSNAEAKSTVNQTSKWKTQESVIIYILTVIFPPAGLLFGILGIASEPRRKQGAVLLCITVFYCIVLGFIFANIANDPGARASFQAGYQSTQNSSQNEAAQTHQNAPASKPPEEILTGWFQNKLSERRQEIFNGFHPVGQAQDITVHDVSIVWKDNRPHNDFNNILEATVRFTISWISPLHNDGFTKVEAVYDNESQRFTSTRILATNGTTTEEAGNILGAAIGTVIEYEAQKPSN